MTDNTLWKDPSCGQYDVRLVSWDVAYESAQEMMDAVPGTLSMDIAECRPPVIDDICVDTLTDDTWDALDDILRDWDDMATDDDGPYLAPRRPSVPGWHALRRVLCDILRDNVDLSEAAWQPTGRVRRVTHDGTSYRWEEISSGGGDE